MMPDEASRQKTPTPGVGGIVSSDKEGSAFARRGLTIVQESTIGREAKPRAPKG